MQFRLHLQMHGRFTLKNLDPIRCPRSGTNRHWGPFRGPASALGYGGTLIITWFRYLLGKSECPGDLTAYSRDGTGEFAVHPDMALAVAAPAGWTSGLLACAKGRLNRHAHLCEPADLGLRCSTSGSGH